MLSVARSDGPVTVPSAIVEVVAELLGRRREGPPVKLLGKGRKEQTNEKEGAECGVEREEGEE